MLYFLPSVRNTAGSFQICWCLRPGDRAAGQPRRAAAGNGTACRCAKKIAVRSRSVFCVRLLSPALFRIDREGCIFISVRVPDRIEVSAGLCAGAAGVFTRFRNSAGAAPPADCPKTPIPPPERPETQFQGFEATTYCDLSDFCVLYVVFPASGGEHNGQFPDSLAGNTGIPNIPG